MSSGKNKAKKGNKTVPKPKPENKESPPIANETVIMMKNSIMYSLKKPCKYKVKLLY